MIGMTELISCAVCNRDGRLRLDLDKPGDLPRVEHGRKACLLPPRDNRLPRITPQPDPAPRWIDRYPSPYRYAS